MDKKASQSNVGGFIETIGAPSAAYGIRTIIPTIRPPASEHTTLKKGD
jgi:hypothetical protein